MKSKAVKSMTAEKLFNTALELAGYGGEDVFETTNIGDRLLSIVNTIYSDLHYLNSKDAFVPLTEITQSLDLPDRALNDCAVYGVASLIQNILGTADDYAVFYGMYNCKKQQLIKKCEIKQVQDVFVKGSDC